MGDAEHDQASAVLGLEPGPLVEVERIGQEVERDPEPFHEEGQFLVARIRDVHP